MARINGIFSPDYPNDINYLRYQTTDGVMRRQKTLGNVVKHLNLSDVDLFKNCISSCDMWKTNDGDHYPTFYTNSKIIIETGAHSQVEVYDTTEQYTTNSYNGVRIVIFGASTTLPLDVKVSDVHTAVMLCDYAIEQLRKMRPEEAKSSPLFALKQSLEADLKAMKNGKIKTLTTNIFDYIDHETYIKVQQRAENRAKILAMIEAKIIPPETKDKKYPLDSEKLDKILPAVQQKYQMHLAKQERKALIKQQRKELKLARIEKRKQLKEERQKRKEEKAKQKKELEDLKQSINEAQIL